VTGGSRSGFCICSRGVDVRCEEDARPALSRSRARVSPTRRSHAVIRAASRGRAGQRAKRRGRRAVRWLLGRQERSTTKHERTTDESFEVSTLRQPPWRRVPWRRDEARSRSRSPAEMAPAPAPTRRVLDEAGRGDLAALEHDSRKAGFRREEDSSGSGGSVATLIAYP